MSKKEYIVLQPKETIVDVEYSDGTVVRTKHRFWYDGEVAHLKFFVNDNMQTAELKQQLAEKDREIEELKKKSFAYLSTANVMRYELEGWRKYKKDIDKELEKLKENQTPTDKELNPQEYDNYNLADKLRYRDSQVRIALERLQKSDEEIETLRFTIDEMSNANKNIHKAFEVFDKNLRHQICEEIRKSPFLEDELQGYFGYFVDAKVLNQIEKGEINESY